MLELKLERESHFLNAMEAMLHLVDVASVDCFNTCLKLRAVHANKIALIMLQFDAKDFKSYYCDEVVSMGIPIDDMVKVIRRADKDDTITIKVGRDNFDTITMSFESPSQKNNITTYELPIADDSSHRFYIPDWQLLKSKYQAFVQMPSAEFMRVYKSVSNIDGDGHISVTKKSLKFFASGKSGHVNIKYTQGCIRFFLARKVIIRETEEAEIKKRKRSKRDGKDERGAEEDKGSAEINGSGEEDKESAEEDKESAEEDGEGSAAPLLEFKLEKESLFLNALEAMLPLVHVVSVDCSSRDLKLHAVDNQCIAVVALFFPAKYFQHYCCNKVHSMGILIKDMVKAIGCAHKEDTITIKVCHENLDTITMSFESPQNNGTTTYNLPVMDDSSHHLYIPDWQDLQDLKPKYQAFVQMPSAEFMRVWKFLSDLGGDGHISMTEKGLRFFASGKSGCKNIKYMQPEKATAPLVTYTMDAPVYLTLDMNYMNTIAKASTLFDEVEICLSTTELLMVQCKIRQGYIRFFLAPKVTIREREEAEITKKRAEGEKRM